MIKLFRKNKKRKYRYLFILPFYLAIGLLRKTNIIRGEYYLFGSSGGNEFNDNSKYAFLTNIENQKCIWVTHSKKVVDRLNELGIKNVVISNSFKGVYYHLFSKMVVVSHGTYDVLPPLLKNVKILQFWHGLPIKKIGNHVEKEYEHSIVNTFWRIVFRLYPHLNNYYCDYFIDNSKNGYYLDFNPFNPKIVKIGYPRLNIIKENEKLDFYCQNSKLEQLKEVRSLGKKIILYMPTYRNNQSYEDNIDICDKLYHHFKNDNNWFFVYKSHFLVKNDFKNSNNFMNYTDADPYPLLPLIDGLITDYSSIGIDYLLYNKPIYYFTYDLEEYENSPGCYFELKNLFRDLLVEDAKKISSKIKNEVFGKENKSKLREEILDKIIDKDTINKFQNNIDTIYYEVNN